jgi:hypothetical protein
MKIMLAIIFLTTAVLAGFLYLLNDVNASDMKVPAGGNGTLWDSYTPKNVEIKAGESVTW